MMRALLRSWWTARKEYYLLYLQLAAPRKTRVAERISYCDWKIRKYRA